MASKTLTAIMKHWTAEFPPTENPIGLPFNIEAFCRENDQALREAEARGMERAAGIAEMIADTATGSLARGPRTVAGRIRQAAKADT